MNRRLLKLGLFLLLGAIVNVGVAWGLVLSIDKYAPAQSTTQTYDIDFGSAWLVCRSQAFGSEYLNSQYSSYTGSDFDRSKFKRVLPVFPDWWPHSRELVRSPRDSIASDIRGWPVFALQATFVPRYENWPKFDIWTDDISLDRTPRRDLISPRLWALPISPLWPGFAINTIFYAAILWLLWIGPGKVRRLVRVRQHRCPACAYLIAPGTCASGLCSECGATLPGRLVRPATPGGSTAA